ncbi:protein downstream neighbor of son homolog [Cyclopterus lumpus]|uniref:DNA replication fork stabilization factor DONSON n=1 Tax=Cyclopterus lumpus TaxID=8103 RepID=A0A8C2X9W8_CYCLU|nr:protein downstream neighbor of son homolog [Cyclopterus lumpus]
MSQQEGYSPSFKRPAEIMRMRRRRTRSDAGVSSSPSGPPSAGSPGQSDSSRACVRPFSPGPLFNYQNRSGGGTKRRNPFASIENTRSPKKKRLISNDAGNVEAADRSATSTGTGPEGFEGDTSTTPGSPGGQLPFGVRLAAAERLQHRDTCLLEDDSLFEEEEEEVHSPLLKSPQAIAPASIAAPVCTEYPADWSLKTRLLFTSPLTLGWAEHPKAQEEALGLRHHCRAQFSPLPHSLQDPRSCSELRCAFQQSLVYWQHPSLPWIPLFPRINAERSFAGRSTPWAQDGGLQQSLMSEWSVSLSSLYSLLKARLCPYFYLCSHQFTVLFRAAGLGASSSMTAFISPTTRGLREAMKAEGIEFSLPLVEERRTSREQLNLTEEEEECSELQGGEASRAGDEEHEDEDGSFSWLKEMGIQDKIKKPDSITMQLHKEGPAVSLDHKPESVVCVSGPHTFTLINFLISCKSLVAAAGCQAGLPPTLLAPGAFRGATMHTLKARSVNVKSQVGSTYQNISSLEITGPILPSSLHTITTLLRPAQKGNFSAALYTHTPTAVMNTHTPTAVMNTHTPTAVMNTHTPTAVMNTHTPTAVMNTHATKQQGSGASVDLSGCGLHPASVQQLQQPSSLGKTALTHINMSNYSYMWKN